MSVYLEKGRGWKYDFVLKGERHQKGYYETKRLAQRKEALRKEELKNPPMQKAGDEILTDTDFLEVVNQRLDHVKAYNSEHHYRVYKSLAKRWVRQWGHLQAGQISREMIERFVLHRNKIVSAYTANRELRTIRATFNWAIKRKLVLANPTSEIDFIPEGKKLKYVPPAEDIDLVISLADEDTQDYLWTIRDTMARVNEINRLTWDDVDLPGCFVILYTRKKKGGHLTPRKVPMTTRLYRIMKARYQNRRKDLPWVFWHTYYSSKAGRIVEGPYQDRKKFMKTLCRKAGVRYFRFHALRHAGASHLDQGNVPIGTIQRLLGHESRETTEIYLHSIGSAERDAIAVLEQTPEKSLSKSLSESKRGLRLVQ